MKKKHFYIWLPVVLFYGLITFMSNLSGDTLSFVQPFYLFPGFDKVIHFSEYMVFGILFTRALTWEEYQHTLKRHWYIYFIAVLPVVTFIDEIHQFFIPNRTMDVLDWFADLSGASFGALLFSWWLRRRRKKNGGTEDTEEVVLDPRAEAMPRFVLPPVILAILIQFFLTRQNIATDVSRLEQLLQMMPQSPAFPLINQLSFWHFTLFFVFGISFFRFLLWQASGRARFMQLGVWAIGFAVFVLISLWDTLLPRLLGTLTEGHMLTPVHLAGGVLALIICALIKISGREKWLLLFPSRVQHQ